MDYFVQRSTKTPFTKRSPTPNLEKRTKPLRSWTRLSMSV